MNGMTEMMCYGLGFVTGLGFRWGFGLGKRPKPRPTPKEVDEATMLAFERDMAASIALEKMTRQASDALH